MRFNNIVIIPLLLFYCIFAYNSYGDDHSPSISSTILIENNDGSWTLQIRSALKAFEIEVNHRYGIDSYKTIEAFKDLVYCLLTDEISIMFGDLSIKLKKPSIQIGHKVIVQHQFHITGNTNDLLLRNSAFKHIYNSKSIFYIVKKGIDKHKVLLNKSNNYEARLNINDNKLVHSTNE